VNPFYFHIGLPKTGTTYLQNILQKDSRINLSRSNIHKFYKNDEVIYHDHKVNVDSNETYLLRGEGAKKYNMMLCLSKIKNTFENVKIIITLRQPYSVLLSMFKYRIKHGAHFKDFDEWFINDEAQDLFSVLHFDTLHRCLNTFFDSDDIYYLFYEDLENGKMIEEFYNILGIERPDFELHKKINESFSDKELNKINLLNKYILQKKIRTKIKNAVPAKLFNAKNEFFVSKFNSEIKAEFNEELKKFYEICDDRVKLKLNEHNYLN
jgi:hypothetical protein